ncbi:hypothetical protein CDV55_103509 [Aspergillus turcosus]|nr:hypothetical protein CDV55_103509 [Aspergillus turcosus]
MRYYSASLAKLKDPIREILEEYSGVDPERVEQHLFEVRERAWQIFPYPCIGQWRFTDLNLSLHPSYPEVLERLNQGQTFLDLGCCMGQDIRKLIFDGVPPTKKINAADLRQEYIDLGFDLFRDREKLERAINFFVTDIFNPSSDFDQLNGKIDVIWAGSFFHLFDWDEQVEVGKHVVQTLRPQMGSLLLGRQSGTLRPGRYPHATTSGFVFRHDPETFDRLWKEIGKATGTEWTVDAHLALREDDTDPRRRLIFAVKRV